MRRLVLEDPFARSAIWSRNLAVFAFVVALIGITLSRKGLDPQASLAIVGAALVLASFAVLFSLVAMAVIWRTGFRGVGLALGGLVLSALLFAYPAYIAVQARTTPPISDVSTDIDDPPMFLANGSAFAARGNMTPPRKQSDANRALQQSLFPDVQGLDLDAPQSDVYDAIHTVIKRHHWKIVGEVEPTDAGTTSHIDVEATSMVMGFPVDITFRIRTVDNRTEVDVRSVSRAGWQEQPGSNAARVDEITSAIEDAIGES